MWYAPSHPGRWTRGLKGEGIVSKWKKWIGISAVALATGAAAADDRAEIEATIAAINAAVMAADKAAYLRHVDRRDPEFSMEQQHWADNFDRHKPLSFELTIVDDPATPDDDPVITDGHASMKLRMRYRMEVGHAKGEHGKAATWRGTFTKHDTDGDGPLPARWLYAGEDWMQMSGTYGDETKQTAGTFVVKYLPGSEKAATQVLAAFPPAKAHADDGFEINVTRRLQIKLYQDMEHLKAWVYLGMPDEILGGWNEPGESIKFMANYTSGVPRWTGAFAHEYGHVATWEMGPAVKNIPWWMAEGVAQLAAEHFTRNADHIHRMMLRLSDQNKLCRWEDIADYDKTEASVKHMSYDQGQHLLGYVSQRWDRQTRNKWIRAVANGRTLDEATRHAFGLSFDELDQDWRRSLKDEPATKKEGSKMRTPSGGG